MTVILGLDEAGYGPNLGPLVVAASGWQVPAASNALQWAAWLPGIVGPDVPRTPQSVLVADSKMVYRAGQGLADLESAILGCAQALAVPSDSNLAFWGDLCPAYADEVQGGVHPCQTFPLPLQATPEQVTHAGQLWRRAFDHAGVRLTQWAAEMVSPRAFNARLAQGGNKSDLLTEVTLRLAAQCLEPFEGHDCIIFCDRHGGRKHYQRALQLLFPDWLVMPKEESAQCSQYEVATDDGRRTFIFQVQGERQLPVALASMTAKYLRETAMHGFNQFWQAQLPELRPTAGYPLDAKRFWKDTAAARESLQIAKSDLWRER